MAEGKALRQLSKSAPKKNDSSRRRRIVRAGAEESRRFQPSSEIAVTGSLRGWRVPRQALRALLADYMAALGMPKAGLTLQMVDNAASQELNRRFRGHDQPTDVLSFPTLTGRAPKGYGAYLGDLALDLPYAWAKRGRFDPDFSGEAAFLLLHGLLHLSGQHHDSPAQDRLMWRLSRLHHPLWRRHKAALRALRPQKKHS